MAERIITILGTHWPEIILIIIAALLYSSAWLPHQPK